MINSQVVMVKEGEKSVCPEYNRGYCMIVSHVFVHDNLAIPIAAILHSFVDSLERRKPSRIVNNFPK